LTLRALGYECVQFVASEKATHVVLRAPGACGTTVSHTAELRPGMRTIAAGTFDDPTWFTIDRHIWVQSKLPWVTIPDNVATYAQGFVASPP
jgi:hypothetical protein